MSAPPARAVTVHCYECRKRILKGAPRVIEDGKLRCAACEYDRERRSSGAS